MSDPIELTDDELAVAAQTAQDVIQRGNKHFGVVQAVIKAINDMRVEDPIGTIRRSSNGKVVAVRIADPAEWACVTIYGNPNYISASNPATWPLVYRPGEGK